MKIGTFNFENYRNSNLVDSNTSNAKKLLESDLDIIAISEIYNHQIKYLESEKYRVFSPLHLLELNKPQLTTVIMVKSEILTKYNLKQVAPLLTEHPLQYRNLRLVGDKIDINSFYLPTGAPNQRSKEYGINTILDYIKDWSNSDNINLAFGDWNINDGTESLKNYFDSYKNKFSSDEKYNQLKNSWTELSNKYNGWNIAKEKVGDKITCIDKKSHVDFIYSNRPISKIEHLENYIKSDHKAVIAELKL